MKVTGGLSISIIRSVVVLAILMSSVLCYSADVVFIDSVRARAEQRELEIATQFYGLSLKVVSQRSGSHEVREAVEEKATIAVAIAANGLGQVNETGLLRALHRKKGNVPLLIFGVTPETDSTFLKSWSGGAVIACRYLQDATSTQYVFGRLVGITRELGGFEIPFTGRDAFYFTLAQRSVAQPITTIRDDRQGGPVFLETEIHEQKIFFAARESASQDNKSRHNDDDLVSAFTQIAPVMMFVRHAAGDRGWHAVHHYANLTIDDPWLREPYGYLDYKALFVEMGKHDFHTTIAFIPWNYDRSQLGVVSLFRSHPDRFSICIHGNNHDHKEFSDLQDKPLAVQVDDLKQSLARMEEFQRLTNIPYDKIMVFPHSIGSESVLEELKTYNFLATINSTNVPMGQPKPSALLFDLRPVTFSFADFPSITRYPVLTSFPNSLIAVNEFLDNPLFFYSHHDLFAHGIGAFDATADEVNKIEPGTEWRSVGEIARHLYLVRLRDDSNYDVLAFARDLRLENSFGRDVMLHISIPETDSSATKLVTVDGSPFPFQLRAGYLEANVPVSSGASRRLKIDYQNDFALATSTISKSSVRVWFLRMASDYRDIVLSKSAIGRPFSFFYYKYDVTPTEVIVFGSICLIVFVWVVWRIQVIVRRRRFQDRINARPAGERSIA